MGNKGSKSNACSDQLDRVYKHKHNHFGEFTLSNTNSKSFWSLGSQHSLNSESKSWTRIYRRSKESTRTLSSELSRTAWPVSQTESYFLPEFPVAHTQQDNKFESIAEISRGAFGKVYKVNHLGKNETFALKVLSKHKILTENSVKQVKEEVQIQKICGHHPFIVNCVLNWQSRKQLFIVTEYIEGGELWQLLQNIGILPIEIIQLYVVQIASAIAPEILKMASYNHSVDWWSLGVIACLMFTAQWPALDLKNEDKESAVTVTLPTTNTLLNVPSRDLLLRLLDIDPKRRLRSIRKLETIAFYKGYNIEDARKIRAKELLVKHFGENYNKPSDDLHVFDGFDEIFIDE
ncbi:ribosomal protein S6 kinase like isoform X2 [Rhynchophorus ferrugineus]|uniref:ribosomal protein S6 kinase like isoform X2 n=1 Tax=Rhynchophorus ferrugineus TaxID=354439 RepID=UPI003FCD43F6